MFLFFKFKFKFKIQFKFIDLEFDRKSNDLSAICSSFMSFYLFIIHCFLWIHYSCMTCIIFKCNSACLHSNSNYNSAPYLLPQIKFNLNSGKDLWCIFFIPHRHWVHLGSPGSSQLLGPSVRDMRFPALLPDSCSDHQRLLQPHGEAPP